jgi:hypothetical protein
MQGGMVANKLQRDMTSRDAVVSFQCVPSDLVRVTETIDGKSVHYREIERNPGVVAELEERYIFFANQAELARRKLRLGQSCVFNVYFREP